MSHNLQQTSQRYLYRYKMNIQLGEMTIIADQEKLYFIAFADQKNFDTKIRNFGKGVVIEENAVIQNAAEQLDAYFSGKLIKFDLPLCFQGTHFQQSVWQSLMKIPFGETRSYLDLAKMMKHPKAFRAVALANAANNLSIVVPCHRVINHNGALGGYAGGVDRKQWLLAHEAKFSK